MHTHTYAYQLRKSPAETSTTTPAHGQRVRDERTQQSHHEDRPTLAAILDDVEAAREAQLRSISGTTDDLVTLAYRDAVLRILSEVRTARSRLDDGTYGICTGCHGRVGDERLEALPWATQCTRCANRRYYELPTS